MLVSAFAGGGGGVGLRAASSEKYWEIKGEKEKKEKKRKGNKSNGGEREEREGVRA